MNADELNAALIESETPALAWERLTVAGYPEIGSTNDEALALVRSGAPSGTLVFSERQTAGRGRRGRAWISPSTASLCFSLVVRPTVQKESWPLFSLAAATALAQALHGSCPSLEANLKWPNDVLLRGKKVAGILVETADSPGSGSAVVIGVGVNVGSGSVPAEFEHLATSLSAVAGHEIPRRRLLVEFLRRFQDEYLLLERGQSHAVIERWKTLSTMWNEKQVCVIEEGGRFEATTCGLADNGALLVRFQDGSIANILAADVSIRPGSE